MQDDNTPAVLRLSEGLGPLATERAAFEKWFLERYSYSRAVLTNPIWAREIADAREAFDAGRSAERERCAKLCEGARDAAVSLRALAAEVSAWRERFPQHAYRPQDDCVALRA